MLSQNVTKRPGWNHEIAIGWRSKNPQRIMPFQTKISLKSGKYLTSIEIERVFKVTISNFT